MTEFHILNIKVSAYYRFYVTGQFKRLAKLSSCWFCHDVQFYYILMIIKQEAEYLFPIFKYKVDSFVFIFPVATTKFGGIKSIPGTAFI